MIRFEREGLALLRAEPSACLVVITQAKGSTPRSEGAWMVVGATTQVGSVGGGALEHQVMQLARECRDPLERAYNLGTLMNQCCGGWVRMEFWPAPDLCSLDRLPSGYVFMPADNHIRLRVHGAGHVCRALASLVGPLPIQLQVVDPRPEYLAFDWPEGVSCSAQTPSNFPDSVIIMTHSHALDFELCQHYLTSPPGFLGLLGSHSKGASFASRLRKLGIDPTPITCPIGQKSLGKEPGVVALSLLHQVLLDRIEVL
ncbi:MAG: xanthine dehydrogenase accessory protein XdhC [Litorivicinus sp.]